MNNYCYSQTSNWLWTAGCVLLWTVIIVSIGLLVFFLLGTIGKDKQAQVSQGSRELSTKQLEDELKSVRTHKIYQLHSILKNHI